MIKHVLMDVDHTLYPRSSGVEGEMVKLINKFVGDYLGVTPEEAGRMRAERPAGVYASTLDWLQRKYGFTDIYGYFRAIHPTRFWEHFPKNSELILMLDKLKVPCSIFTNSWSNHALNVMDYLEITPFFKKIYDLPFCHFIGKPDPRSFRYVLDDLKLEPDQVLLADDAPETIIAYTKIGGKGVLVDENLKPRQNFPAPIIKEITQLTQFTELF